MIELNSSCSITKIDKRNRNQIYNNTATIPARPMAPTAFLTPALTTVMDLGAVEVEAGEGAGAGVTVVTAGGAGVTGTGGTTVVTAVTVWVDGQTQLLQVMVVAVETVTAVG